MHKLNIYQEEVEMELKEMASNIKEVFAITDFAELPEKIMEVLDSPDYEKVFDGYVETVGDLQIDYMQKIYQFWLAKRGTSSAEQQDYTPESLAKLTASLLNLKDGDTVYDACAGSGALTIAVWRISPNLEFVCHEFDEQCFPILLFNLAVRGIKAVVLRGDVLKGEIVQAWEVVPAGKYSAVRPLQQYDLGLYDACISNPPYNLKCDIDPNDSIAESMGASNFANANYLFLLHTLSRLKPNGTASFILPCGVMSDGKELAIRKHFVESGLLKAVIVNPGKMFESTDIPTCIFLCQKSAYDGGVVFVDGRKVARSEIRQQRGEGDASHTNRIYKRTFQVYAADGLEKIQAAICEPETYSAFAKNADAEEISQNDYMLTPGRYIIQKHEEVKHRPFEYIVADIQKIQHEKNAVKITMNETLAKKLGFQDLIEQFAEAAENTKKINATSIKCLNLEPVEVEAFFKTSKKAGEIKIENVDKNKISSLFPFFLNMWRQHIYYLNECENELLAEFRDALLPKLMNGEIDLDGIDIDEGA